jgi:ABC-type multidrug transport system fused ATPase/permease subunit
MSDKPQTTPEDLALESLDKSVLEINAMVEQPLESISIPEPLAVEQPIAQAKTPIKIEPEFIPELDKPVQEKVVASVEPVIEKPKEIIETTEEFIDDFQVTTTTEDSFSEVDAENFQKDLESSLEDELKNEDYIDDETIIEPKLVPSDKPESKDSVLTSPVEAVGAGVAAVAVLSSASNVTESFAEGLNKSTQIANKGLEFFAIFNSPSTVFIGGALYLAIGTWLSTFMGYDTYQDRWSLSSISIILGWVIPILVIITIAYGIFKFVNGIVVKINNYFGERKRIKDEKRKKRQEEEEARVAELRKLREKEDSKSRELREKLEKIELERAELQQQIQEKDGGFINTTIVSLKEKLTRK